MVMGSCWGFCVVCVVRTSFQLQSTRLTRTCELDQICSASLLGLDNGVWSVRWRQKESRWYCAHLNVVDVWISMENLLWCKGLFVVIYILYKRTVTKFAEIFTIFPILRRSFVLFLITCKYNDSCKTLLQSRLNIIYSHLCMC